MAASQYPIDIIFKATTSGFETVNRHLRAIERATGLLGSALHRLKIAAQFYISFRIFGAIYKAMNALTQAIPDLIRRGEEWAAVLDDIQDSTGMTALETSKLAGVAKMLGINVEGLGRQFAMFARGVIENEDNLKKYGIRIRDANGELRSSWEIFNSVREAVSSYGKQLLSTSAMQQVFGKSGFQLLDMLQMTGKEWRARIQEAKDAGLFMSQAAINAAEAWKRTRAELESTLTGLGQQILGNVAPVLSALVAGIAHTIQANMAQIVDFVSRVITVIAGFVGGLLGISFVFEPISRGAHRVAGAVTKAAVANRDFGASASDAADGSDRQRNAIEKQTDAIDRQLKRLDLLEDRRKARREYQELMTDISDAKQELSDLRSEAILESGMSAVEAELARQAHAADIVDAQKKLGEAKKRLVDFQHEQEIAAERRHLETMRDRLQDQLGNITAATGAATQKLGDMFQTLPDAVGKGFAGARVKITDSLKGLLADSQRMGSDFAKTLADTAESLRDIFLGDETPVRSNGITIGFSRSGGLIKSIQDLSVHIANLGKVISALLSLIPGNPIPDTSKGLLPDKEFSQQKQGIALTRDPAGFLVGQDTGVVPKIINGVISAINPRPIGTGGSFNGPGFIQARQPKQSAADVQNIVQMLGGGVGGGGFQLQNLGIGSATRWQDKEDVGDKIDRTMEKYMGASSDTLKVQMESAGLLEYILGSTDAITAKDLNAVIKGRMGVGVEDWSAGELGTSDIRAQNIGAVIQTQGQYGNNLAQNNLGIIGQLNDWMHMGNIGITTGKGGGKVQVDDIASQNIGASIATEGQIGNNYAASNLGVIGSMRDWMSSGNIGITTGRGGHVDVGTVSTISNGSVEVRNGNFNQIGTIDKWTADQQVQVGNALWAGNLNQIGTIKTFKVGGISGTGMLPVSIGDMQNGLINIILKFGAKGAAVGANEPIIVGEEGPELFRPSTAGQVYSNPDSRKMLSGASGGTSVPQTMNVTVQLDPVTTRLLLSGRPASTTTRAAVGV